MVPYLDDQKAFLALILSSSMMLKKGMSLLGSLRFEYLGGMWWNLYRIKAGLGTNAEPIGVKSSSDEDELTDLRGRGKRRKLQDAGEDTRDVNATDGAKKEAKIAPKGVTPIRDKS